MTPLLTGCAALMPATEANAYRQITMQEAAEMMEKEENDVILHVRTHEEFTAGHIPGAIVIPNETIGTEKVSQLPDQDQLIMVYCRSGKRSKQASDTLVKLGYTNIVEFGGIIDWPGETISGMEQAVSVILSQTRRPHWVIIK